MDNYQKFSESHKADKLLHIGNVWDVNSALLFEKMGYPSLGTSSTAVANSLGYEDGEEISFNELLSIVKSITKKVSSPFTVDIEAGYSRNTSEIVENIILLSEAGVSGINIEDSVVVNGKREITNSHEFSELLKTIKNSLIAKNINVFLNARTDFFLMGLDHPLEETVTRAVLYENAGADGIFVPCVTHENDIKKIIDSLSIPLNVMAMPDLPAFDTLQRLGVSRVSMGPFVYNKLNEDLRKTLEMIEDNQSFDVVFQ